MALRIYFAFYSAQRMCNFHKYMALLINTCTLKRTVTSFGVMSKAITHYILNRLLYLLAKFQGQTTTRTLPVSNFQKLPKIGNYFCELVVCDVELCHAGDANIQDYVQKVFTGIFCTLYIIIILRGTLIQTRLVQQHIEV